MGPIKIDRHTRPPIDWYNSLLNANSLIHGTPISIRAQEEFELLNYLKELQRRKIKRITSLISKGRNSLYPADRKYNMTNFQQDYMGVSKADTGYDKGANADVRDSIDLNSPNFVNSEFQYWSDLNSRSRISNIVQTMERIEGKKCAEGRQLFVVRPTYERKTDSTDRLTANNPALQNVSTMDKKNFLVPEEGFVFVGADIQAQEPVIFFNGMCYDKEILDFYETGGDIYLKATSKASGIPIEKLSNEMREQYKVGLLRKMNGSSVRGIAFTVGDYDVAQKISSFVDNNQEYQRFKTKAERQAGMDVPRMEGFLEGLVREITVKKGNIVNQLLNSPLQLTGVGFFAISMQHLITKLMELNSSWANLESLLEDVRFNLHAHDEILLQVRNINGYPEMVSDVLEWALSIHFEDWTPMRARPYISEKYDH